MNWKIKAFIQNAVSLLPPALSYSVYYKIQRYFGELRSANPIPEIKKGLEIVKRINQYGGELQDMTIFEVGTGRRLNVPLLLWLSGVKQIITVDLNPYLKKELVKADLKFIFKYRSELSDIFRIADIDHEKLRELKYLIKHPWRLKDLLSLCNIQYIAPGDAASIDIDAVCVDVHISNTVLEHIPPEMIIPILNEGNRMLKTGGLFIHRIDYSDHFSHSDKSISSINFLQFSPKTWDRIADNRYMYMNRLRHDDFETIFNNQIGHKVLSIEVNRDKGVQDLLRGKKLHLNEMFQEKPLEILSITGAWIVTKKMGNSAT